MLTIQQIDNEQSLLYPAFAAAYEASFPANERRSPGAQRAAFRDPRYRLDAWLDQRRFIGFMGWWDFADFRYIEHVAIAPEARSGGYGSAVMKQWLAMSPKPVLLEIEEVVDDQTRRRCGFYERLGFKQTPGVHIQPAYQGEGGNPVMQVLSWPDAISEERRRSFVALLHAEVWADLRA